MIYEPNVFQKLQGDLSLRELLLDSEIDYRAFLQKVDFITDEIAIGSLAQLHQPGVLEPYSFRSILSVDDKETILPPHFKKLATRHVALRDAAGNGLTRFEEAVSTLKDLVDSKSPVFVHCHAGRSRSPAVVAGYLVVERGVEPDFALDYIASRREINVAPPLRDLLMRFADWHR